MNFDPKDKNTFLTIVAIAVIVVIFGSIYFLNKRNQDDMSSLRKMQDNSQNMVISMDE